MSTPDQKDPRNIELYTRPLLSTVLCARITLRHCKWITDTQNKPLVFVYPPRVAA